SLWGTLTNKIKSSTFFIFENLLEPINIKASSETVLKWKRSEQTKVCYKQLFNEVENNSDETYMSQILKRIWPSGDASKENIAYAIAITQTMLNPKYDKIMMSDTAVKNLIKKNLICIY
ncbi:10607_t:CDS:1, partial [Scutellospora calospora]